VHQASTTAGSTPLYIAADVGHGAVVVQLLKAKDIAVNQANARGVTPLFIASQRSHGAVVALLRAHDAK
jgi:ankyrin repeat protein